MSSRRALKAGARRLLRPVFGRLRARRPDLLDVPRMRPGEGPLPRPFASSAIDDPDGLLARAPANGPDEAAHPRASGLVEFIGYDVSRVDEVLDRIRIHRGLPPCEVLRDVVYLPAAHCLYQRNGRRIEASYLRAGATASPLAPATVRVPRRLPVVEERMIFAGSLRAEHYGHFLTEGIARLWYAFVEPELRVLSYPLDRFQLAPAFFDHILGAVGLESGRFAWLDRPVRLREVVLPHPSFVATPDRRDAFEVHRLLPEAAARALLEPAPQRTAQPLYLTRARLAADRRQVEGEHVFERELLAAGFAVVAPEQLDLAAQIRLVNAHDVVVGTLGSALHTLLFDLSGSRRLVCLGYGDAPHPNYLMIDAVKQVHSLYVAALSEAGAGQDYSHGDRVLDVERAHEALRQWNLL